MVLFVLYDKDVSTGFGSRLASFSKSLEKLEALSLRSIWK